MRGFKQIQNISFKSERKVVGREKGIVYFFRTNEKGCHNKKHVHARYQDTETSIGLDKVETLVLTELRPRKKHKEALGYVKTHKIELLYMWDEHVVTDIKRLRARRNLIKMGYSTLTKRNANARLNRRQTKSGIIKVVIKNCRGVTPCNKIL